MKAASSMLPFVIWIVCIGIAALALGIFIKSDMFQNEGFTSDVPIRITTCPSTTITHITSNGDTNCCDGDIMDRQCNGTTVCSLSPKPPNGLLSCTEWIMKEWNIRSDRFCPKSSMPYYFGTMGRKPGSVQGCSASPQKPDGSSPRDLTKPQCKIYDNAGDDYAKVDSCFNVRAKDAMMVPLASATRAIIPINGKPALLQATYMPTNKSSMTPVSCYDWNRFKIYLDSIDPTGNKARQYASQKDTDYKTFCGPSKAYYVDGTLSLAKAPTPYDNGKTYRVGDQVILNGKTYKMVEAAGAAGYSPERQGDKLWQKV